MVVAQVSQDRRIKVTVELAGGTDQEFTRTVKRQPPLIIIHGRGGHRVPFSGALELPDFVGNLGSEVEAVFLPKEGHLLSPAGITSALGKSLWFLQIHLN